MPAPGSLAVSSRNRFCSALSRVATLVRASHERWDGDGYPDRLTGDAIPVGARIVAVADAFAAMLAGRPYREARTPEQALDELRRMAGTQFDPVVVDAWCAAHAQAGSDPVQRKYTSAL